MQRLWGRRSAFNVQKALWTLGELDLAFEHVEAGGAAGGLDQPQFLALNPHGLIPVLEDGGVVVWESHAIVRYLCARYGGETWWPSDPAERSLADRWMDWAQTTLQPDFMNLFWGFWRTPESDRKPEQIKRLSQRCADHFALLDRWLADRPYLAGDAISMGDIPAGATLWRYFGMGLNPPRPANVMAWFERLAARPAYRAHIMSPFDSLKGRLDF